MRKKGKKTIDKGPISCLFWWKGAQKWGLFKPIVQHVQLTKLRTCNYLLVTLAGFVECC